MFDYKPAPCDQLTYTFMATGRPDSVLADVPVKTLRQYKVFPTLRKAKCSVLAVGPFLPIADARVAQSVVVAIVWRVRPFTRALCMVVLESK